MGLAPVSLDQFSHYALRGRLFTASTPILVASNAQLVNATVANPASSTMVLVVHTVVVTPSNAAASKALRLNTIFQPSTGLPTTDLASRSSWLTPAGNKYAQQAVVRANVAAAAAPMTGPTAESTRVLSCPTNQRTASPSLPLILERGVAFGAIIRNDTGATVDCALELTWAEVPLSEF